MLRRYLSLGRWFRWTMCVLNYSPCIGEKTFFSCCVVGARMHPRSQTPGDSGLGLANDARMIRTTYVFGQVPSSNLVFFSIAPSLLQVYGPGTHQTQRIIMHATRHRPFSPPLSESITFSNTPMWSRWSPGTFVVVQCPCRTSPSPSLGRPAGPLDPRQIPTRCCDTEFFWGRLSARNPCMCGVVNVLDSTSRSAGSAMAH